MSSENSHGSAFLNQMENLINGNLCQLSIEGISVIKNIRVLPTILVQAKRHLLRGRGQKLLYVFLNVGRLVSGGIPFVRRPIRSNEKLFIVPADVVAHDRGPADQVGAGDQHLRIVFGGRQRRLEVGKQGVLCRAVHVDTVEHDDRLRLEVGARLLRHDVGDGENNLPAGGGVLLVVAEL